MKTLPNVLIVDDLDVNLILLEEICKNIRVNLIRALSGTEALEKTKEMELALAILDVRMPEMSGYELALKLNEKKSDIKVPIIFITANYFDEMEVIKGYGSGAVDYVFKPVNARILQSKINVFLDLFDQKQTILRETKLLKELADELTVSNVYLRKSEERYFNLFNNANDLIQIINPTGKFIAVNKKWLKTLEYSQEEVKNIKVFDIIRKDKLQQIGAMIQKVKERESINFETIFISKSGKEIMVEGNGNGLFEDGKFISLVGIFRDVTERKLAEDKLKESQTNLEEAQKIAQVGSWQLHLKTNIVKWSKEMFHIYDIDPETFDGNLDTVFNIFHPDDVELSKNEINNLKIGNSDTIDYRIIHKDGSIHYLHREGEVVIDKKGKPIRSVGTVQDITERKLAENALKVSEEKYRTMLNAFPDGIMIIDLKGIITEVSGIGLELLGAENRDELIGKLFFRFVPTEGKTIIEEAIKKTLNEGIAQNIELKIRKKNQSLFLSEISLTLIQSTETALFSFMITIRDISQRKKMEKKQIHADRMSSLGEMASGIAHEINQPLNIISLVIDNILYEAAKDENIGKEYLKKKSEKILKNIIRIKNIIDHIRAFSRINDDYILTGFDINSSINNAVIMISKQFEHLNISLDIQLEGNPPLIIGNTFQFEQVILNLLSNAKDALLEKKNIRKAHFDMLVGIRSFKENQCFVIKITDNGIGISEEDIENIILPFYTTKDTGKGTGLGLSISYQIIKEMNGTIEISSDKHTGTTFKIILKIQNKK